MDEEFVPVYLSTGTLEGFSGRLTKIVLNGILGIDRRGRANGGAGLDVDGTVCPGGRVSFGSGGGSGGGGWSTDPPDITDPDPVTQVKCTVYADVTDWYQADGTYMGRDYHSIWVECEDVEGRSADGDPCAPLNGEIGIILDIPDPLDLILEDHGLTDADLEKLRGVLEDLIGSSCAYEELFDGLTSRNAKLSFGYDPSTSTANYDYANKAISFRDSDAITVSALREELIHAFQDLFYEPGLGAYRDHGRSNIEFEAKFMIDMMSMIDGDGNCCSVFGNEASIRYEDLWDEYRRWLLDITNVGATVPDFADIETDYFEWLDVFRSIRQEYNYPVNILLNPIAAFNLMNKCQ